MKFVHMLLTAAAAVNVNNPSVSFKGRKNAIDVNDLIAGDLIKEI